MLSLFKPMQVNLNLIFQKLNNLNQFHKIYLYFQSQILFQIKLVNHYDQYLINSQYSQFDKFNSNFGHQKYHKILNYNLYCNLGNADFHCH